MAYFLFQESLHWFLGIEALIFASLVIAYGLYRRLIAPVKLISDGVAALRDRDFGVRFRPVGSREMDTLIEVYNDMIDSIRSERVQTRSQHLFLQQLVGAAELGLIILDYDDNLSSINPWGMRQFGLNDNSELPQHISDIDHPLAQEIDSLHKEGSHLLALPGNRRYRCDIATFIDQGFKRRFILVQDVSNELFAAEKEAYGKVIRMMAHEVNNSFGASRSLINSLLDRQGLSREDWEEMILEYLPLVRDRGESLSQFMRRFAEVVRLPTPDLQRLPLNELMSHCYELFKAKAREHRIALDLYTSSDQPHILGDRVQLEQVIINAALNALESIGEQTQGQIEFRVFTDSRGAGFSIVDDGPGIDPELQEKIFSPFFSSKVTGQGVGLTLSQDILRQHGANYHLQTEEDGKTRFWVRMERY